MFSLCLICRFPVLHVHVIIPADLNCTTPCFWSDLPHPLLRCGPTRAMASSVLRFLDHTQRRITVSRTPLDEWSARRWDLYLTIQHSQQTDIHAPVGFEPTISAGERPKTYALDRAANGTGELPHRHMLLRCKLNFLTEVMVEVRAKFVPWNIRAGA